MADDDLIQVRNKHTQEVRDVFRSALPFFPDWEHIDSQGRPVRAATSTTDKSKES